MRAAFEDTAVVWVVVATASLAISPLLLHRFTQDSIAYLSIAEQYADGHWVAAVNAYWSPLISWLMAPFIALGLAPLWAAKVIQIATAVVGVWAVGRLSGVLGVPPATVALIRWAAAPLLVWMSLWHIGGDAQAAVAFTAGLAAVLDRGASVRRRATAGGAWISAGCLAKAYVLPVALVVLVVAVVGARWWAATAAGGRPVRRSALGALGLVVITALAWSAVLNTKYDRWTFSAAATGNMAVLAPSATWSKGSTALVPPPNPHAVDAVEDPSQWTVIRESDDGPTEVDGPPVHLLARVPDNLGELATEVLVHQPAAWLVLLAIGAVTVVTGRSRGWPRRREDVAAALLVAFAAAVWVGGVLLLVVERRYVWGAELLLVAMGAAALAALPRRGLRMVLGVALALAMLKVTVSWTIAASDDGRAVAELATELDVLEGTRVAAVGGRQDSRRLCYLAGCRFYGAFGTTPDDDLVREEVVRWKIDHVVVWPDQRPTSLAGLPSHRVDAGPGVTVVDTHPLWDVP